MELVYVFLVFGLASSVTFVEATDDVIDRLARLEDAERVNKLEISTLNEKMAEMDITFHRKEKEMMQTINELRDKCEVKGESGHESQTLEKRRSITEFNDVVETEIAFYATHTSHDIQHLGAHQIITFDQNLTNIGNAYNSRTGAFVAPVDGTYVFHVTLMGTLHDSSTHYYSAYIDVDGVGYSRFYIVPYDQSSHMFVIELKTGSQVSVRNERADDGVVGQHYSAFSGFLLYQHGYQGAIVGK